MPYYLQNFGSDNRSSTMHENIEEDILFGYEDEEILEKVKMKLGFFAKSLIWAK